VCVCVVYVCRYTAGVEQVMVAVYVALVGRNEPDADDRLGVPTQRHMSHPSHYQVRLYPRRSCHIHLQHVCVCVCVYVCVCARARV
jgi:hypothetical protein